MSPTCLLWCGCHSYGRCLATAHWAFSSYGRLEAERVNQFWWNLVHDSKLRLQWQLHDQILFFLKFKMADGRHIGKCWKWCNWPTNGGIGTKLGWQHLILSRTCPPWCGCHGTGRAEQRRIEYSAIMGVWRPNAWTNFDEIWYTRADNYLNDSLVIKY